MKILHFADTHIDAVQSGRWDPDTGLPVRAMDFLKSLDTIIDTAINEKVDLVLFAGDAYKDRNPTPQYQDAFSSRILRLEEAQIPTLLLVGNHDMGALSKAHALTDFKTFGTEYIKVIDEICHFSDFYGLASDVICLPWVHKSQLIIGKVIQQLEELIEEMDTETPNIFLGHCSVVGARFSSERLVMLGDDLMLPMKLLTESGFDYVALGHIHKTQVLHGLPPVVYPGSIERVDWGEAGEDKGFMIINNFQPEFRILETRPMLDYVVKLESKEEIEQTIYRAMDIIDDGNMWKDDPEVMIRIKLQYPEQWAGLIHNQTIEQMFPDAFSVQVTHDPIREGRTRLDLDQDIASYAPGDLLQMWLEEKGTEEKEQDELLILAKSLLGETNGKEISGTA